MSDLALERQIRDRIDQTHPINRRWWPMSSGEFDGLIQRLREAKAENRTLQNELELTAGARDGYANNYHEAEARAQMNFETVQKCSARIAQLERVLGKLPSEMGEYTLLDLVERAADHVLLNHKGAEDGMFPDKEELRIYHQLRLVYAALAAVEKK